MDDHLNILGSYLICNNNEDNYITIINHNPKPCSDQFTILNAIDDELYV